MTKNLLTNTKLKLREGQRLGHGYGKRTLQLEAKLSAAFLRMAKRQADNAGIPTADH